MKTEAKPPEAAQPVGRMKWNDLKVVYTDKKSKQFDQVKKDLGKYREGKWGNPKGRTRGNGAWRHYVHTDAQGVESHIKVIKKEKGFEFFTGLVSGVLIPPTLTARKTTRRQILEQKKPLRRPSRLRLHQIRMHLRRPESAAARVQTKLRRLRPPQGMVRPARRRRSAVDSHRSKWRRHLCIRYVSRDVYPAVLMCI